MARKIVITLLAVFVIGLMASNVCTGDYAVYSINPDGTEWDGTWINTTGALGGDVLLTTDVATHIVSGQFDNDPYYEIAYCVPGDGANGAIWIQNCAPGDGGGISRYWVTLNNDTDDLAAGDLDGDGLDEIIFSIPGTPGDPCDPHYPWVGTYYNNRLPEQNTKIQYNPATLIATGQFDSDPNDEVVFNLVGAGVYINDGRWAADTQIQPTEATSLGVGNVDGTSGDEVIYSLGDGSLTWHGVWVDPAEVGVAGAHYKIQNLPAVSIAAGDVDADGLEEIVFGLVDPCLAAPDWSGTYVNENGSGTDTQIQNSIADLLATGQFDSDPCNEIVFGLNLTPDTWDGVYINQNAWASDVRIQPTDANSLAVVSKTVEDDTFLDATAATGLDVYNPSSVDNSAAWGDYDNDGDVDLYIGSGSGSEPGLFTNNSGSFTGDPCAGPGANAGGALWVDFDNDGDLDLYTTMAGAHASRNNGTSFAWINGGLGGNAVGTQSECHAWGDFNNDGLLDFYRSGWQAGSETYPDDAIFMNNGTTFDLDWQGPGDEQQSRGIAVCDFDEDGDVDIYVSNYYVPTGDFSNYLQINDGTGSFTDQALAYGVKGDGRTVGSAWGDLDNDGHFDLVVGNFAHPGDEEPRFLRNIGSGGSWHFEDKSSTVGLPYVESHASPTLGDFDNDGDLDVFITAVSGAGYPAATETCTLMRNNGSWSFTDVSAAHGLDITTDNTNFQASWGDYDNDGDLDLYTGRKLYMNTLSNGNRWLTVKLVGDGKNVNRDAVGAQVRIATTLSGTQVRQVESATGWGNQNDPRLHFGLGAQTPPRVDLEIIWPDGTRQVVCNVRVDQFLTVIYEKIENPGFELPNAPDGGSIRKFPEGDDPGNWPSAAGTGWDYSDFGSSGVADIDSLYLNGVVPDGNQACIIFENGAVEGQQWYGSGQVWQDMESGWLTGHSLTVNWKEAMGYVTHDPNLTRYPDLVVSLVEITEDAMGDSHVINQTTEIQATSLQEKSFEFIVDRKLEDGDEDNDVVGYRLLFEAKDFEANNGGTSHAYVVVDSVSIVPTACVVNLEDFARLAERWLDTTTCALRNDFCSGTDVDRDQDVDVGDMGLLAEEWLNSCPDCWSL